jgi:CBS domain-containing protein
VGSVIVTEDNKPLGIITEKDILDGVVNAQKDPAKSFATDIMRDKRPSRIFASSGGC